MKHPSVASKRVSFTSALFEGRAGLHASGREGRRLFDGYGAPKIATDKPGLPIVI